MLKELKFVQGAVSKKDVVPAMKHFAIENGTVRAYNGVLALCSPLAFDIECKPDAAPLVQAINNCNDVISLSITPAGKLKISSGNFRAFINCLQEETPHVQPEGQIVYFDGDELLKGLKVIYEFIGDDASRPWSNGVLLRGQSAFATNNVCLVEYWLGSNVPHEVNIPRVAIKEMLRINEAPIFCQIAESSITFHYQDGRWVRSQLLDSQWPAIEEILNKPANPKPIDARIFEGLDVLEPFIDKMGRFYFEPGIMRTSKEEGEGAQYDLEGSDVEGVFNLAMFQLLKGVVTAIDLQLYPQPCIFYGDRLRGAIVGMRL